MRRALPLLAALLLTPSGAWAQEVAGSAEDATVEAAERARVGPEGSAAPTQGAEVEDGEASRVAEADEDGTHGADAPAARDAGPARAGRPSPGEGAPSEPAIDPEATPLDLEPPDGVAELLGLAAEDGGSEAPEPEIHETWWFWASIAAVVVGVTIAIVVDVTTDDPAPSAPAPMGLRLGGF